jgi:hypothetical protein
MTNRDYDQGRQWRNAENGDNWDWYYYEYRYLPDSPYRRNEYDRNYYGRESNRGNYESEDRGRDYNRGDYERENYNRDYGTSYGRYSGVGPRGYKRSDDRIADDVNDRLTWHGYVDATDIEVDVNDGIVTLKGTVDNRRQKRMAEDAAEMVSGVWDVNNQLNVRNRSWDRGDEGQMGGQQIRPGMEVIGRDGNHVGEVKEVRSNDFLVDRTMARDVYIPFSECQSTGGQIRLNVRTDEVDAQNWEMPEIFDTETQSGKKR